MKIEDIKNDFLSVIRDIGYDYINEKGFGGSGDRQKEFEMFYDYSKEWFDKKIKEMHERIK